MDNTNLIENIIQSSLSKSQAVSKKRPSKKHLNPLLWVVILLSIALVATFGGLLYQNQSYQQKLTLLEREIDLQAVDYDQSLQLLQNQITTLSEEANAQKMEYENLSSVANSHLKLANSYQNLLQGIYDAELIIGFFQNGYYQTAADILNEFVANSTRLPFSSLFWDHRYALGDGYTPFYSPKTRLLEVAQALKEMDLVDQSCVDYVDSLVSIVYYGSLLYPTIPALDGSNPADQTP